MIKKEKLLRYIVSNLVIVLVVGSILTAALIFIPSTDEVSAKKSPIYQGSSETAVALMISVYNGTEHISPMLKIFENFNIKVTFFVGGLWAAKNEDLLKEMYAAGHEIGNHGYLNKSHSKLTSAGNYSEINVTHKLIGGIINYEMNLFAPPSGDFSDVTLEVAEGLGYKTIMWTNDTIDWRDQDAGLIKARATKKLKGGNLVLMRPTEKTAEALPDIISAVKNANLDCRTVSEVL